MCFPLKNSPHALPGRKAKFLNESVFWRHPEGYGVFLAVKPHESLYGRFALFLRQLLSGQTGESGSPVWENETGWAWNIDFWFKFLSEMWIRNFPLLFVLIHLGGVFGVPDWGRESLSQVGIEPNLHPKWIVLCTVPVSVVSFWLGKDSIHLTSALTILL